MQQNQDHSVHANHLLSLSKQPVSRLGFASQYLKDLTCVQAAFTAGINFYFSYNLSSDPLVDGLMPLLTTQRNSIFIATGSESRHPETLQQYLDQTRRSLNTSVIDAFFIEYFSPSDSAEEIQAVLAQLRGWKTTGSIRCVGASTHNLEVALQLIQQGQIDVLMLRYNMAHRKVEDQVLPMAQAVGLPVIAFTCTRWGTLLKGHPQWNQSPPTATDCYRFVLHHPAIHTTLTAPATLAQLQENLTALTASALTIEEVYHWQTYGNLIYGTGQDAFETQWI
ncbi:MAG: aldo/keto reductase [Leptolyngbya sp. Prado105]|jgi:aryl-alcohol dehydrogenase-like predicted oxidoreductase|nr:aldo/keto reductase [Leptolyngbya sp. Prado105]